MDKNRLPVLHKQVPNEKFSKVLFEKFLPGEIRVFIWHQSSLDKRPTFSNVFFFFLVLFRFGNELLVLVNLKHHFEKKSVESIANI